MGVIGRAKRLGNKKKEQDKGIPLILIYLNYTNINMN